MPLTGSRLELNPKQCSGLEAITQPRSVPATIVLRARIILGLAEGKSYRSFHERPQTSAATIARWRHRFEQEGLAVHPGRPPSKLTPALRAKVLAKTAERPPDGAIHWSCRKLARVRGLSKSMCYRIWRRPI